MSATGTARASMIVWVVLSTDEAQNVAVTASAELGMAAAQADVGDINLPPDWVLRSDGRYTSYVWDYEVRPFEVVE